MKKLYLFSLGLMFQNCVLAANPNFYVLYIRNDNNAMIHSTDEKIGRVQELPMTVLESKQSTCCFVFWRASQKQRPSGVKGRQRTAFAVLVKR